jgi:hypothetical protein
MNMKSIPDQDEMCQLGNRSRTTMTVRRILQGSIFAAGSLVLLVPQFARADELDRYNFGPNGSTPGVLTPTAVGLHLTATNITADAGLALDLTSPATAGDDAVSADDFQYPEHDTGGGVHE